jgi:multiple sugar transport system substrate-binding protein
MLPLRPPHSLMTFFTLAGNLGTPCMVAGPGEMIGREAGSAALELIREMAALVDPECFAMDPIAVFEKMAAEGSQIACAPLIYGYVNYAVAGFRPSRIGFADIPVAWTSGPVGSALGGTGIAVSAFSQAKDAAIDFAYWIASAEVQRGPYAAAGGQSGHAAAWEDDAVNAATGDFYRATRRTLEGAWLRPRHNGYMDFQRRASDRLNEGLIGRDNPAVVIDDLNRMFSESLTSAER